MDTVILGRGIKCKCGVVFADLMGMSVKRFGNPGWEELFLLTIT
jgi:hypothetical protein